MHLLTALTTLALAASAALAQTAGFCVVKSPSNYETVAAGTTYTVRWEPGAAVPSGNSQISISLLGGDSPGTLQHKGWIETVDAHLGKYDWPVDRALGTDKVYGLEMRSVSETGTFQYSFPFYISAAAAPEPTKTTMSTVKTTPTPKPAPASKGGGSGNEKSSNSKSTSKDNKSTSKSSKSTSNKDGNDDEMMAPAAAAAPEPTPSPSSRPGRASKPASRNRPFF